jgi:quercetin dioxygenase-like cupin family protein
MADLAGAELVDEEPGVRARVDEAGGRRFALVEYAPGAGRAHWCEVGHEGYVLEGEVAFELAGHDEPLVVRAGQGFVLPERLPHLGRNRSADAPMRMLIVDTAHRDEAERSDP